MPNEFNNLVGKRMLFKVEVPPPRDTRFERTFSIRKIAIDEGVIDKFVGVDVAEVIRLT